jgi:hypothetical protein
MKIHWDNGVDRPPNWPRICGRGLALIWAAFWCLFGLSSSIADGHGWPTVLLHAALPGAVFATLAAVACWKERGGNILVVTSTLTGAAYAGLMSHRDWASVAVAILMLSGPSLLAGLLLEIAVPQPSVLRISRPERVPPNSGSSSRLQSVIR